MNRILALARKDLRDVLRERSIVLALLVQLFVAAFSAFLAFGLIGLFNPDAIDTYPESRVAYTGPGGFDSDLRNALNLDVIDLPPDQALDAFRAGAVDALVIETYPNETAARTVTLLLPEGEFKTTLLVTQLKELLRAYERDLRAERDDRIDHPLLTVDVDAQPTPFHAFAYAVLIPLLVLTPAFLSGAIAADAFTQEADTRTLELLRSAPLRPSELLAGKLLAPVLLAPAQVLLWSLLLHVNDFPVHNVLPLLLFTAALALLLSAAGAVLAVTVQREGHVQSLFALAVLVVLAAGYLLPRDPFNLIARFAADSADAVTWITLALVVAAAVAILPAAAWVAQRRLQ